MITVKHFATPDAYCYLCPEGQRLLEDWKELINRGADSTTIYAAMKAYFFHKNGVVSGRSGKKFDGYCPDCTSWETVAVPYKTSKEI